ncbi:hypothetical protein QBC42DRAFT_16563 [Cladorrhinum samala]|uniref:Uncharacterized protein n=1 Tax=Cladorrhinum samala TaxID=585594 RepID=A0AAV9HGH8_9PEZI|nr:hypothetical protein QBC42DRAFT_16563 [Cladorrhinum samala]
MANNTIAAQLQNTYTNTYKVNPNPVPDVGAMSSAQASESQSTTAASADAPAPPPAAAGFAVLTTADSSISDASNPHRDGRIRNPVPSKLKGKTDGSKGNFSVMHMDVTGRTEATERDAEAKRTSESTELAAKRAFENGYVSHRRSRFVQVPDDTTPMPIPKPFVPAAVPTRTPTASTSTPAQPIRHTPLSAQETKSEQARLLTLLRSLHPVLVVDQICKALAFFGGIPGAPPPADGIFPPSAESNGSGSLFVGWIAEIFPKLGGNAVGGHERTVTPAQQTRDISVAEASAPASASATVVAAPTAAPAILGRRKRGRPKGSKGTKPRVDKGIKKGSASRNGLTYAHHPDGTAVDESWVDVDDDGIEAPDDVDANVLLLAQANTPQQQHEGQRVSQTSGAPPRTALPGVPVGPPAVVELTASARKRGRPKGSKNRPRDSAADSLNTPGRTSEGTSKISQQPHTYSQIPQMPQASSQSSQPHQASPTPQPSTGLLQRQSFTAVNNATSGSPAAAKKSKKATGNKQRSQGQPSSTTLGSGTGNGVVTSDSPTVAPAQSLTTSTTSGYHYPASSLQATEVLPVSQGQALALPTPPTASPALSNVPNTNAGQKRKRKQGRDSTALQHPTLDGATRINASPQMNSLPLPTPPTNTAGPSVAATSAPSAHSAKRQRKGKPTQLSNNQTHDNTAGTSLRDSNGASPDVSGSATAMNALQRSQPAQASMPVATEPPMTSMSSIHSPQQNHFEVQSPTMENYEAQLQAQLEQQAELEPQAVAHYSRMDSTQTMANRLHQQQQQQPQRHSQPQFQQRQQQSSQSSQQGQQQSQQQTQQTSASHSKSPSLQSQPAKSQATTPLLSAQQQTRTSQNQYSQYRTSSNTQYNQPQNSQQTYASSRTQQPQQHNQNSQTSSSQQYSTTMAQPQPQQYSTTQQSYGANQQQYPNGQQQQTSQQRFQQQLATSSASTTSYSTHQSPQFSTSTSNTYNGSADGTYRSPATSSLATSSYNNQRSQTGTPTTTASFRANSGHSLAHHSPSYSSGTPSVQPQQRSASTGHTSTQSLHGMSGAIPTFTGNTGTADWNLFDATQLDTSGQQAAMGLSNSSYGLGVTNVRTQNNAGSGFTANLANFDTSGLGGGERFYNAGRR